MAGRNCPADDRSPASGGPEQMQRQGRSRVDCDHARCIGDPIQCVASTPVSSEQRRHSMEGEKVVADLQIFHVTLKRNA